MNTYKNHPWQQLWVKAIRQCADSGRFSRGRSYVALGAVAQMTVEPGHVVARVHGSRPTPYETELRAPLMDDADLLELPLHTMAELLTYRTHPEPLHDAVTMVPSIIPDMTDVKFVCSCPDWGYPCKHAIATALYFGGLLEQGVGPFLRWRGIDNVKLVQMMMHRATSPSAPRRIKVEKSHVPPVTPAAMLRSAPPPEPVPLQANSHRFWHGDGDVDSADFAIAQGPDQAPEWVFRPPLPWPERPNVPTYVEVICWAYDLLHNSDGWWDAVD